MKTSHRNLRRHGAFTLVEIMIVVVIIGLLAALAVPAYFRAKRATQNSRTANDFRVFAQAFEIYVTENGTWPANVGAGVVPTSPVPMNNDFKTDTWCSTTAIGGLWNWDVNRFGFAAGVSISNFTCDTAQLAEIDARIDDGNLSTGLFQLVQSNRVMLVLE